MTQHLAFKHGFPPQRDPDGERRPVPNRGLAAASLILVIAFALCTAFTLRHSKLFRLYRMSSIEVAHQLRRRVFKLSPNIRAPDS